MTTPDHSAASRTHLKREMALLTAEFAAEQALERLRREIKLGRTAEIIECAPHAATAVMEVSELVTLPDDVIEMSPAIRASVTGCLREIARATKADDAEGVLSAGELVGDAVANYTAFLKHGELR